MTRLIFYLVIGGMLLFMVFAFWNMQDTYKILPMNAPKKLKFEKFETWVEYTPPTEKFTVMVPVRPQHASERLVDPTTRQLRVYNMYVSESLDGTAFMISLINFPDLDAATVNKDHLMSRAMHDMVSSNKKNELVDLEKGFFKGFNSFDFKIQNPINVIQTKTFVDGNTMFVLSTITREQEDKSEEYDYFIESFKLKGESPNETP